MKTPALAFAFLVSALVLLGPSIAQAQSPMITVFEFNGTTGQYSDLFLVKLTVDGDAQDRGYTKTGPLPHAEIYWQFDVPANNGNVMVTANAIPHYQLGGPTFVPYDPSGAFCSEVINPNTQVNVMLLVTEDANGVHCSFQ